MTIEEAYEMIDSYRSHQINDEDSEFEYIEALSFIIKETDDPRAMMELGGHYYDKRDFNLALKYYDMAAVLGYESANECLGYIWYYGRTGVKDYEKAFKYFSVAAERGNIVARYKLADMYKNGYFVEKNYEEYKRIIKELYPKVKKATYLFDPLPEVFTRLASIKAEEGDEDQAIQLYLRAREFLAQRIAVNPFFGNLNIMKWLIEDLYKLIYPEADDINFYDLYYYLRSPIIICLRYANDYYTVAAVEEDEEIHIKFEDKWYISVDDFFKKANIGDKLLTELYLEIDDIQIKG